MYQYGLSTLHAWIRCMECLLHISYRLDFKTWQARDAISKDSMKNRKQTIQQKFRDEMGLLVDIVKQGSGTTNDGNTARKFFSDPAKTATIIGLDCRLIHRFATLLRVLACGQPIISEAFAIYARLTAEMYVELYGWYYMPSSVHKLLFHGAEIIKHFNIIPIGQLSEEASEARNKDFKKIREHHSRKFCRKATNEDIFNGLLVSSDPYLSSIRPVMRKSVKTAITDDMKPLLTSDDSNINKENIEFVDVSAYSDFNDDE